MLNLIVEDVLSEAVIRRLLLHVGFQGDAVCRVTRGNIRMRQGLPKYIGASRFYPHILLTDLDQAACPPELLSAWGVTERPDKLLFRIAVREVESWLMADRDAFAGYLHVAKEKIPFDPEAEADPKACLFRIVRRSRRSRLITEIVPTAGAHIGPLYNEHFCHFVQREWQVTEAVKNAPSLARCVERLAAFCQDQIDV